MKCDKCGRKAPRLTHDGTKWICPECVPEEIWAMYPPAYKQKALGRLRLSEQRSVQARKNFHKEAV